MTSVAGVVLKNTGRFVALLYLPEPHRFAPLLTRPRGRVSSRLIHVAALLPQERRAGREDDKGVRGEAGGDRGGPPRVSANDSDGPGTVCCCCFCCFRSFFFFL